MYKKAITYTDYNDITRTEDFYFNLNEPELTDMINNMPAGIKALFDKMNANPDPNKAAEILDDNDTPSVVELFKTIILSSYGEKSADGRRFTKKANGHKLSEDFEETEAYAALFMELASNPDSANAFIKGVFPKSIQK